ncbi:hypothetical protein LO762_15915 [Actinocorallia sp. API 0066]|uniref:hypothetical protein n=1 Tax=Actinocorallia sp. API 0066 TaxID=2896846 RepID=UPI001E47710F|nr:hypothetical protein [Actinocorallia sp. API 0066]MCD0450664.1 hypothetical protein [Actinocorallia sp. API 0066]
MVLPASAPRAALKALTARGRAPHTARGPTPSPAPDPPVRQAPRTVLPASTSEQH